jgi:hypothetical protein
MFPLDLFRSFLPLRNPIGFGASDFIELLLAALLVSLALASRPGIEPLARKLAPKTGWCMLLLALLPVALRLVLLPSHPVPTPDVYDEFGHLLVADTLRHFRLANPPHPMHRFFETFFILQEPTYSSIYTIGQGLLLELGELIFGVPWAGVVLSTAAFCSLCYWMLRAWTTPAWALLGGLLAVAEFGPLNQWMNSYWGGSAAACAGCLVFGALPRLRSQARARDAIWLGLGLALHLLIRPYESIFLLAGVILFFVPLFGQPVALRRLAPAMLVTVAVVIPVIAITIAQNKRVTGNWLTLPEMLSQYQYGVPASLTFQANPVPHRELTPQQALEYRSQMSFRAPGPETIASFLTRLEYRVRFYRFFFLAPLYIALPAFFSAIREYRFAWVALTLLLFALGVNFFPAFQFHYVAAAACLFVLVSVIGLLKLSHLSAEAARIVIYLCAAHFLFWYGLNLFPDSTISTAMRRYETWDAIDQRNPERRILIQRQLAQMPGKLLLFVRYWPQHIFQDEWVYNAADIDRSRIVWARDLGAEEDEELRRYYPDRAAWLLEPDATPPKLSPYQPELPPPAPPSNAPAPSSAPKKASQPLRFEQVR